MTHWSSMMQRSMYQSIMKDKQFQKVSRSAKGTNRVNMQKIQVFKSGEKDSISGLVKGLQGAEFTFKLHSEVNHVGWDNATTYAVITTDSNGKQIHHIFLTGNISSKETKDTSIRSVNLATKIARKAQEVFVRNVTTLISMGLLLILLLSVMTGFASCSAYVF